jgi:fatty acid desaturase
LINTQISEEAGEAAPSSWANDYPELKRIIKARGLLEKQRGYYVFKFITSLSLLALSVTALVVVDDYRLQLVNAAFLAFVFGQIGFLGHDAGHNGVTRSARGAAIAGLSVSFLVGLSRSWWITQHNQHHSTPNNLRLDPHTLLPLLAFSQESALEKSDALRSLVRYQAFYFVPLLLLEGIGMRLAGAMFLWSHRRESYSGLESLFLVLHFSVYFAVIFYFLSPWHALGFVAVHQALYGLYNGLVFAPNHKGMLIIDNDNTLDFFRTQVLTTRTVKPNMFIDFWFGGLNYQIEHHLFPSMARNKLGEARIIIKDFCEQHDVSYYETGLFRSSVEVMSYLHRVGAPVKGMGTIDAH